MALPTSGIMTWAMIRDEFGGGNPIGINQYYRGGSLVPNVPANNGVPTSGTIYASQFYGARKQLPLSLFVPGISSYAGNGTRSVSSVAQPSGGTGSYTVTGLVWVSGGGGLNLSISGLSCVVSGTGTNVFRNGTARCTVSDGQTSVAYDFYVEMQFGTPI